VSNDAPLTQYDHLPIAEQLSHRERDYEKAEHDASRAQAYADSIKTSFNHDYGSWLRAQNRADRKHAQATRLFRAFCDLRDLRAEVEIAKCRSSACSAGLTKREKFDNGGYCPRCLAIAEDPTKHLPAPEPDGVTTVYPASIGSVFGTP
jgi:hypothetical protein